MTEASPLSAKVAEEIRALLARRDMSRSELARRLGVSAMWVSDRLRAQTPIGLDDLERIAAVLGVAPADLFPADVLSTRKTTQGYFDVPDRPRSSRPVGGPPKSKSSGPPNGAQVRRSRVTGVPLAVANSLQVA